MSWLTRAGAAAAVKRNRRAPLLILLLAAVFALAVPRPAPDHVPFGEQQNVETANPLLCVHTLLENEVQEAKIKRSLVLARELGATTIVQFFPWAYHEPSKGRFNWERADRILGHANRQGLQVIARLGLVPAWARPSGPDQPSTLNYLPAESFEDFARYAAAFARRYAEAVKALIIWNEPNLSFEWGYRQVDPAAYARLLRVSYEQVKAANPDMQVLAGALAPTLERRGSAAGLNELEYLSAMYRQGAGDVFDALAIHTYGFRDPPAAEPNRERLNFRRAELLREVMIAHGDGDKPAFITEFGWNDHPRWTSAVRPSQRSAYTIRAYDYAKSNWDWLESLCLWALRYPADLLSYPDNFTLVSADFSKKPIYFALQDYSRQRARSEALWLPPPLDG
ncbi:MAG: beta-galactosidase [Chloroflexota bacterium]|nr:beta-galactosidase [Chloroflexota bacterium]MDE2946991.1 beta-galactosidase [Chloroflexota bacterium]